MCTTKYTNVDATVWVALGLVIDQTCKYCYLKRKRKVVMASRVRERGHKALGFKRAVDLGSHGPEPTATNSNV